MPNEEVEVIDGPITFEQWLKHEKERIESTSGRQAEIRRKDKRIALFVNRPKYL